MRIKLLSVIIFALIFFSSSSKEGAASVAPDGELPAAGFFAATNSFPKNSVVEITNLDNDKTVRVVVSNNLNRAGMIAIISLKAADSIGLRPGTVGRIRMTQPSDPLAYQRMQEGNIGWEYFNSDVITEDEYFKGITNKDNAIKETPTPPEFRDKTTTGYRPYILEPEWGGNNTRYIYDLPGPSTETAKETDVTKPNDVTEVQKPAETDKEETKPAESGQVAGVKDPAQEGGTNEETEPAESGQVAGVKDPAQDEGTKGETKPAEPNILEDKEPAAVTVEDKRVEVTAKTHLDVVESEERPPRNYIHGIDKNLIIQGIAPSQSERAQQPPEETRREMRPDPNFFITRLDRGKYYVQIATLNTLDAAERTVSRIDIRYEPKVFKDSNNKYQVLLGPLLNQGESAAILQRFKSFGFNDAMVRYIR